MNIQEAIDKAMERGSPIRDSIVSDFETSIASVFPDDYRKYLTEVNGGFYGGLAIYTNKESKVDEIPIQHILGFQDEYCTSLVLNYHEMKSRLPEGHIAIMDDVFGNHIILSTKEPYFGAVYFLDHEYGSWGSAATLLETSFSDFLTSVKWEE